MTSPVRMFAEGGPFMYLLLLIAMGLPVVVLAAMALTAGRIRVPKGLWMGAVALPLGVGVLGTWMGTDLALQAIAHASSEMKWRLAANGGAVALYPVIFGAFIAAATAAWLALAAGGGAALAFGADQRWTPALALPSLIGLVFALGLAAMGAPAGAVCLALCSVAGGMVNARFPSDSSGDDAAQLSGARGFVAGASVVSMVAFVVYLVAVASTRVGMASASATPSMAQNLSAQAMDGLYAQVGLALGGGTVLAAAVAIGFGAVASSIRWAEVAGSVALAFVLVAPVGLLAVPTAQNLSSLYRMSIPYGTSHHAVVERSGLKLPSFEGHSEVALEFPTLQFAPSVVSFQGEPVGGPEGMGKVDGSTLMIEASGFTMLSDVARFSSSFPDHQVWMLEGNPLRQTSLSIATDKTPVTGTGIFLEGTTVVVVDGGRDRWVETSRGSADTVTFPRTVDALHVWPGEGASVQDLFTLAGRVVPTQRHVRRIWHHEPNPSLEPPFPQPEVLSDRVSSAADFQVLGSLDRSLIQAVVKRHLNQIRYCYQRELTKNPALQGEMSVKFTVAKDGSVSSASKRTSTLQNPSVEQCVVGRFKRMKFPPPKGGGIAIVNYPFTFGTK